MHYKQWRRQDTVEGGTKRGVPRGPLEGQGSVVNSPAGYGAELSPKTILVRPKSATERG